MSTLNNGNVSRRGVSRSLLASATNLLRQDPKVLLVPLIGLGVNIVVMIVLGVSAFLSNPYASFSDSNLPAIYGISFAVLFAITQTFSQAAVIAMANQRFEGQTPTLGSGFSQVGKNLINLLTFALMDAIVGFIMRMIQERFKGILGGLISLIGGLAWAIAAYFAIPVIMFEGEQAFQSIGRSSSLIKSKWGQALKVNILTSAVFVLAWLVTFGAVVVSTVAMFAGSAFGIAGFVLSIALLFAVGLVQSTVIAYVKVALYRFAVDKPVPGFDEQMTAYGFSTRKK